MASIATDSLPVGADMAWASFPCQDLSLAGSRKGMKAERSGTYWEFWRLMRDSFDRGERPPLIVIDERRRDALREGLSHFVRVPCRSGDAVRPSCDRRSQVLSLSLDQEYS